MSFTIMMASAGTSLAALCDGCILGAIVYLTSRGVRNPLRTKKK